MTLSPAAKQLNTQVLWTELGVAGCMMPLSGLVEMASFSNPSAASPPQV